MLGSDRVLLALALVSAVAVGCGGGTNSASSNGGGGQGGTTSSSTTTTSGGGGTGGGGTGGGGAGGSLTCMNGEGTVLAVSTLSFGEGNSGEWKKVGFNIDGLVSTTSSKDVCQPSSGAAASTPYPDGDEGIDNSFGKNLLPTLLSVDPTFGTDINNGIQDGVFTSLLKLECLPPMGDVPSFTTKVFGGTGLGFPPKFDGTDKWPVAPELLSDPKDPLSSTVVFSKASVIGTTFDSGKNQVFILSVPLKTAAATTSLKLNLYAAQVTMTLNADRTGSTLGLIGGVLNTEELVTEIKKVGALMNLCNSPIFPNLLNQIRQASDIMTDGTQDPAKTCDGISIGLGFEMKEAQIGDVGMPTPVGMTCP
jgi:hypothetical protein